MFDLQAVQASLREFRLDGWLLYDFRGSQSAGATGAGAGPEARREPAVLLLRAGGGCAAQAGASHRDGRPRRSSRGETGLSALAGAGSRRRRAAEGAAGGWRWSMRRGFPTRMSRGSMPARSSWSAAAESRSCRRAIWSSSSRRPGTTRSGRCTCEAEQYTTAAFDLAFGLIAERVRAGGTVREAEVQSAIMDHFHRHGMTTYSPPIVGVGPHSGDPHYEPVAGQDAAIGRGDFVLVDLWAKMDRPRSVYSDLTRVGFVGDTRPAAL